MAANAPDREVCFLALTRPAMTAGVPTLGLMINLGGCFFGGMVLSQLSDHSLFNSPFVYWLLALPIHAAMRRAASWDFHCFRTLMLWVLTTKPVLHVIATRRVRSGKGASSSG